MFGSGGRDNSAENVSARRHSPWHAAAFSGIELSPTNADQWVAQAETPDKGMVTNAAMLPPQQRDSVSPSAAGEGSRLDYESAGGRPTQIHGPS